MLRTHARIARASGDASPSRSQVSLAPLPAAALSIDMRGGRVWLDPASGGLVRATAADATEFIAGSGGRGLVRIAARDIDRITAERDYMRLHVGKRSWLIYRTIAKLEEELDPALFIRVHRSAILRRDTIAGLTRDNIGHWAARLADGSEQRIGRSHIGEVKKLAGRA